MATCNYHQVIDTQIWDSWTTTSASGNASGATSEVYYVDNEYVWESWTQSTTSGSITTACYGTSDTIWVEWNRSYENCGTTVTIRAVDSDVVWEQWISDGTFYDAEISPSQILQDSINKGTYEIKKYKAESIETKRAKQTQQKIRHLWNKVLAEEREAEVREAEVTAQELLLELIGEEEMARYKETGRLFVKGDKFDYVLRKGGGVHRIKKDKVIDFVKRKKAKGKYICVHPKCSYNYPETDNVISLKLWIENAEEEFLKIGNLHSNESDVHEFDKIIGL